MKDSGPAFLILSEGRVRDKPRQRCRRCLREAGVRTDIADGAAQFRPHAIQKRANISRRFCLKTCSLDFLEPRQNLTERPTYRQASALHTNDHWVAGSTLPIAGGPHPSRNKTSGAMPKKDVLERRKLLRCVELFPRPGIDLPANALNIQQGLGNVQAFGFQPQLLDMVVPARMFSERGQKNLAARIWIQPANIFEQKFLIKVAHSFDAAC